MIKPIHLLVSLVIGMIIGYFMSSPKATTVTNFKALDSLHTIINKDKKDLVVLNDTLQVKNKQLEDAHTKRIVAEKKAKDAETRYALAKAIKPVTHKDSIVYMQVTSADCDTLNTTMKQLVNYYFDELQKSEGVKVSLQKENEKLISENNALVKADSIHVINEKALVKKARKNLMKGGLIGVVGGILVVLIL